VILMTKAHFCFYLDNSGATDIVQHFKQNLKSNDGISTSNGNISRGCFDRRSGSLNISFCMVGYLNSANRALQKY
jgi:hypothetical protein